MVHPNPALATASSSGCRFVSGLWRSAVVLLLVGVVLLDRPSAAVVTVRSGADLQDALNSSRPGDVILLERGAEYVGNFVLPARSADVTTYTTLRTRDDFQLPADGQRIHPGYARRLAKIRSPNGQPALRTAPGAHHWRVQLIEFAANAGGAGDIIALGDGSTAQRSLDNLPHDLLIERLYIHGDERFGQKRAIALNAAAVSIRDSWISEIKAVGQDSQAIAGWNGPGPYLIENNRLEAAGENILFGGADPAILGLTPTDIRIRRNRLSKPLAWRDATPRWQVKNLLELKNARQVTIEDNLLEHVWQGAQTGYAVLFTVRNQDGNCPWCQVESVTFQRNRVRDAASGVQVIGTDPVHPARPMRDIVITGNLFEGLDRDAWGGDGYFMLLGGGPSGVRVEHNTVIQRRPAGILKIADGISTDFAFANNIAAHGEYGILGTNRGIGDDTIRAYLPGARIERNVIAGGDARRYPPDNLFPSVEEWLRHFQNPGAGTYALVLGSPWRRAATDRRDLGADVYVLPRR